MYYVFAAIAAAISLWLIILLYKQFVELGRYIKWKHPFFYRLYVFAWILLLLGASTTALVVCGDAINSQKYTTPEDELAKQLESAPIQNNYKTHQDYQIAMIQYGRKIERESHN